MVKGRDDFVIALRSAFFKKKEKQKFSLISLIILSIIVIIFSNFNFKPIQIIKLGINEVIYRSSYISSVPENKIKEIISKIKSHIYLQESHEKELIKSIRTDKVKFPAGVPISPLGKEMIKSMLEKDPKKRLELL